MLEVLGLGMAAFYSRLGVILDHIADELVSAVLGWLDAAPHNWEPHTHLPMLEHDHWSP
jgi:hypothetical protein